VFGLTLNLGVLGVEIVFLLTSIFFFLIDKFIKNKNYAFYLTLISILVGLSFLMFTPFGEFAGAYKRDFYSATIQLFLLVGFLLILLTIYPYLQEFQALNYGEFYGLLLFSVMGAFILVAGEDLITFYLGIELMSIPIYFLIASFSLYQRTSLEGSLKYFIAGTLSSAFILLGLAVIYYFTGSLFFKEIFLTLSQGANREGLFLGLLFILAGFSIKLSLVPFHMWAPDAYQSAPLPVTSFLAGIIKLALFSALIKLLIVGFSPLKIELGKLIIPVSLITILIGALLAIKQDHLIRMLAYSSIAHVGYASLGLITGDYLGYGFIIFYLFIYLFMTIGTFGLLIYLVSVKREYLEIPSLSGLSKYYPFLSFLILIFFFSLAGIPPTAGFMAKFYFFIMLLKGKFWWVALLALLFSVIGAYPYLRVIKVIYMDEPLIYPEKKGFPFSLYLPLFVSLLVILIFGIYPKPAVDFIQRTIYLYLSMFLFYF